MYAIRRIKDGFQMHKTESDKDTVEQLIKHAEHNYEVIQRQVTKYISVYVIWRSKIVRIYYIAMKLCNYELKFTAEFCVVYYCSIGNKTCGNNVDLA